MRRRAALGLCLVWSLAQAAPSVTEKNGDLYLKQPNGTLKRLTNYGGNFSPVVSPDGEWVAYNSTPQWALEKPGGPPVPSNIWLMRLQTTVAKPLSQQSQPLPDKADIVVESSEVSWSAESAQLVWAESRVNDARMRTAFVGYTIKTGVLNRVPAPVTITENGALERLVRGPAGLWAMVGGLSYEGQSSTEGVVIYRPEGSWQAFGPPRTLPSNVGVLYELRWLNASTVEVEHGGGAASRLNLSSGQWKRVRSTR